ncbi:MAG: septum formation initiator family protein [Acidobacteria bacterium]|nr:septum formation initiator family protein [Acidobacteriota bacterium]MBV9145440.1 septum formation initiator family protein [Acidobacteriota bacterium]MBV9436270.1 septum formation initiator family protein [Acidobacteriota bacterium]
MRPEEIIHRLQPTIEVITDRFFQWRRRAATAGLCLLAGWVGYHVVFGANGTMVYSQKIAEHRSLNKEILQLKDENGRLAHQVDALRNDPKAIEKEAREQLRYARPGEIIYTLPQSTVASGTVTAQKR